MVLIFKDSYIVYYVNIIYSVYSKGECRVFNK